MPIKQWFQIEVGNEIAFSVVFHIQPWFQAISCAYWSKFESVYLSICENTMYEFSTKF